MDNPNLSGAMRLQAQACDKLGSPFHGALLLRIADDIDADGPAAALMTPWANASLKDMFDDAVQLRLVGALHDLVLSGDDPALAATYPKPCRETDPEAAWAAVRVALVRWQDRIADFMTHEPQTNEVRRSACLVPGFLKIASETRLPIRAFEVAASAGLNLSWDRYAYAFGETSWGDPQSPVRIDTDWTGAAPPIDAAVEVIERAACDRRPGDLSDPVQRRRLLAYIWPDQFERLARISAAIDLARRLDISVEAADAVDWTWRVAKPKPGAVTVLYHSVFWQYMPPASQAALTEAIDNLGASATPEAPFAWLRMEPPFHGTDMEVRLTLWPGGEDRLLATCHPHGAWVKWVA